jgi:hypothetical protein
MASVSDLEVIHVRDTLNLAEICTWESQQVLPQREMYVFRFFHFVKVLEKSNKRSNDNDNYQGHSLSK